MSEDRKRVLGMLAEGKITADEAERLLDAMGRPVGASVLEAPRLNNAPKYFRVEVNALHDATKINVRVPLQLLRAGVRLSALIPPKARDEVNAAMAREGIPFDINQLKPENLDELIEHLADFKVDVDSGEAQVRVYCE
ncbi:MAG: SHOCT-like domain-containing protein [Caulobacteraceae bacterium]